VRLVVHHGCNCCWWSLFAMVPRKPGALVFFDAWWFGWRAFEAPFVASVGRCGVVALFGLMSQHVFDAGKGGCLSIMDRSNLVAKTRRPPETIRTKRNKQNATSNKQQLDSSMFLA
jgi:hypothetical protein